MTTPNYTMQEGNTVRYIQPNGNRLTLIVHDGILSVMATHPDGRAVADIALLPRSAYIVNIVSVKENP